MASLNLVVLISGSGSNLQAIIDNIESGRLDARIACVLSNRPDAYGLTRAEKHGIPAKCIDHTEFASREAFDSAMIEAIEPLQPDFIVLAGFMRILTPNFIHRFEDRLLNIHPSLLPKYQGLNTHQRALENGDAEHGVSIHLVTEVLDDGPILLQATFTIEQNDTVADLEHKAHAVEHLIYPQVLEWLAQERLTIRKGQPHFDEQPMEAPLQFTGD